MYLVILVISVFSVASARPGVVPQNVITVPPNCPDGQEWINGACRDIWKKGAVTPSLPAMDGNNVDSRNMITVPPNCPPGQQIINGQCRDIWRGGALAYSEQFAKFLEKQFAMLIRNSRQVEDENIPEDIQDSNDTSRNIISVPNQCPRGYRPDALGICRKIF